MAGGRGLGIFRMGADARRTKPWLKGWNFQPHLMTPREGRGARGWIQPPVARDLISYASIKTPTGVWELLDWRMHWCAGEGEGVGLERAWKLCASLTPPPPTTCSTPLFHLAVLELHSLSKQNKTPVVANRVLSWVLQIILVSYQTWWGRQGCENSQTVVSWAEMGITWGPLLCWYRKWGRSPGNEPLICGIRCYLQVPWNWIELTPTWCHRIGVVVWENDTCLVSEENHAFGLRSGVRKEKSQCRMLSHKKGERSKSMCLDLPILSQRNSRRVD